PGRRTAMGRQLRHWLEVQGLKPQILGEFDDAALMKAFGFFNQGIFVAPAIYREAILQFQPVIELERVAELKEEYYVIFAERMIQHPAVKRLCESDFDALFSGLDDFSEGTPPATFDGEFS